MKVLIVEDNVQMAKIVQEQLQALSIEVTVAISRSSAFQKIEDFQYDYIILDLRIPNDNATQDKAVEENGVAVFKKIKEISPGTPICIYTAFSASLINPLLSEYGGTVDIWGAGEKSLITEYLAKDETLKLIELVKNAQTHINELKKIEISSGSDPVDLSLYQERILRIFSRMQAGDEIVITKLNQGLSGAKVLRTAVRSNGDVKCKAIAKLNKLEEIQKEVTNYTKINKLSHTSTPHLLLRLNGASPNDEGVFYSLADGETPLFDYAFAMTDEKLWDDFFKTLEEIFIPWKVTNIETKTIKSIRQKLLRDEYFDDIRKRFTEIDFDTLENKEVRVRWQTSHGDLHGHNILVNTARNLPILIDFGDIKDGPACLDAVTLELSCLFHPAMGRTKLSKWPEDKDILDWHIIDSYIKNCPFPLFIKRCRKWAHNVQGGNQEFYATCYAFVLRQFKYSPIDEELAVPLLKAIISKID